MRAPHHERAAGRFQLGDDMDLAAKVAELDKTTAVQATDMKNHIDRDNERFDHIVRGIDKLGNDFNIMSNKLDKAITRAHDRIDEEAQARGKLSTAMKSAHFQTRIYVLTAAVVVLAAISAFFLQREVEKRDASAPSIVSGAKAGEPRF